MSECNILGAHLVKIDDLGEQNFTYENVKTGYGVRFMMEAWILCPYVQSHYKLHPQLQV